MYISKIELINIRCYDHLIIDLTNDGDIVNWTTILGDNGTGKSTILKCIALGLCDFASAAGLIREIPWKIRNNRFPRKRSEIRVNIVIGRTKYEIITGIIPLYGEGKQIETIDREILKGQAQTIVKDIDFKWDNIFICGYGAARNAEGTDDYLTYSIVDAVYTLFRYDQPLQNPELAMRRFQQREERLPEDSLQWLNDILDPILLLDEKEEILLQDDGIWIDSNKWGKTPLASTGDGYKATLTWLMDFISWASYYYKGKTNNQIKGIVLIDEIEQHLHPSWQRNIVDVLRKAFKNIQFISTTHSPLVTINSVTLGDESDSKLFILKWLDTGKVTITDIKNNIADLGFDQILGSEAFGFIYENPRIEKLYKELSELVGQTKLNRIQQNKVKKIEKRLLEYSFMSSTSPIERNIIKAYKKNLIDENKGLKEMLK